VNNYFGRQWNSLNDVAVNPQNGDVYFTDTLYGYLQMFRPSPEIPNQVYRFTPSTGAVSVVADGFDLPNGGCCPTRIFFFAWISHGDIVD
jgi:gluconolactonase